MEREAGLPSTPPPADLLRPLSIPITTILDGSENKDVGIGLRTFNDSNDPYSAQSVVLLPASGSIQADLTGEAMSDDEETPGEYKSLADDDENADLYQFLKSFGITRQHIDRAQVSRAALWKLYQQEFSYFSWLKWSSLDHAVEKYLQWPLLSPKDIGSGEPKKCDYRVRPHERSILLKTSWGLIKAYAVRGFVQGVEMGLLEPVHYFIYAMLAYRLGELAKTGQSDFEEFQSVFSGSSQKGMDSLVRSLAGLEARWLKLILAAPFIFGVVQGIVKMRGARSISAEEIKKTADRIQSHLKRPSSFWRDVILEEMPLLALSSQVQKLEQWVRWDGRLDHQSRKQAFELIRRVAWEGDKVTQLNALESLAKIAHGIGLKDLPQLQQAGYSLEELTTLLYIKATALADLEALSQRRFAGKKILTSGKMTRVFAPLPRRLYAGYLLWWLGQSTSWWTQRLPFALLKIVKLGLEVLFLQKIATSILEAINCPDKPGFQFGNGYQDWASDYTSECFKERVNFLRTLDTNESVAAFVAEIPQYHLTELTILSLSNKYLTSEEASQIIQAVVQQGASFLQTLDLHDNYLSELREDVLSGLSQLTSLDLSTNHISTLSEGVLSGLNQLTSLGLNSNQISILSEGVFSGLSQLTSLDLEINQINVLSEGMLSGLSQLTSLDLSTNQINVLSEGVLSGLSQLTSLDLGGNRISVLNEGVFSGLSQLTYLYLYDNRISVLSEDVFSGLSQLTTLSLGGNQISVLSGGMFSGLSQLQTLDLSMNHLNTSTIIGILSSLPSALTELGITTNRINYLPQNFSTLLPVGLKSLSVGSNSFIPSVLTQEFMQYFPFRLTSLGLASSLIVKITDNSFSNFSALTTLNLGYNQINVLSEGVFSGLNRLTTLDLEGSQINVLSEGVFSGLSQLTTLDLEFNRIIVLSEGMLSGLSQLTTLYLGVNRISVLSEGVFSGLSQLNTLDLGGNRISVLSEGVFSGLSQLTYLYLYGNQISVLSEGMFSGLSQLTYLYLYGNQISVLSKSMFIGLSQLTTLDLFGNQISVLSKDVFSGLSQLTTLYLYGNQISVLSNGVFSGLSQLTYLDLSYNQLNDTAIQNITQNFPYQLNYLEVSDNQIGNDGALALAEIFPCTNLTAIYFAGNPTNDTTLAIAAQQTALQKICEDQRCHANLPATESCGVSTNPTVTAKMSWGLFESAIEVDETESDFSDYSYWPHPAETPSFQPTLALSSTTPVEPGSSSLTPVAAGAMILGVLGIILLYKNSTWMQALVNTGSRCFQRCWSGEKTAEVKTVSPARSSNRRYAFLPNLSISSAQQVTTVTRTTDMTPMALT